MSGSVRLSVSRSVVLDANGEGSISLGPYKYTETWNVSRMSTRGNSTAEPDLRIYRGAIGSDLLDTSARGNGDISETGLSLRSGENITAVYSLGTSGAVMTFYLEGEITYGI